MGGKERYPSVASDRLVRGMGIRGGWDVGTFLMSGKEMKLLGDAILRNERKYGDGRKSWS